MAKWKFLTIIVILILYSQFTAHFNDQKANADIPLPREPFDNNTTLQTSSYPETSGGFLTYRNDSLGFSIQYPTNWTLFPNYNLPNIVQFQSPAQGSTDRLREIFGIAVGSLHDSNTTSEEYINGIIAREISDNADYQFIKSDSISIAGNPGFYAVYTYTEMVGKVQNMIAGTIKDVKPYLFSFTSEPAQFESYLPTIQSMINSFEIIG